MIEELIDYKESTQEEKGMCFICAMHPCICTGRRAEERIEEIGRKEGIGRDREERKDTDDRLVPKVKISPNSQEEKTTASEDGRQATKRKHCEEEEEDSPLAKQASISRPQHQPLAHQAGVGAKQLSQQPHHQREGDGGAAGIKIATEISKVNIPRWANNPTYQPTP